jgi:hypothetical protein
MGDNESALHRLGEDVVTHLTFIHRACKKLEGPEGQTGVQFNNALDTLVKYVSFDMKSTFLLKSLQRRILESIEVFVRGRMERNAFHRAIKSTADGAKIQEYRNKLARIMRHLEVISPPNLHVPRLSHHIFSSA